MTTYWPCGAYINSDGHRHPISTYDSFLDLGQARKQIEDWQDWYKYVMAEAHIDVYQDGEKVRSIAVITEWKIGDRVRIRLNKRFARWHTPRWADGYQGEIIRLNDATATIRLDDYDGMKIRADYWDLEEIEG